MHGDLSLNGETIQGVIIINTHMEKFNQIQQNNTGAKKHLISCPLFQSCGVFLTHGETLR